MATPAHEPKAPRDLLADPSSFRDAVFDDFDPSTVQYLNTGMATTSSSTISLNYVTFDPVTQVPHLPSELLQNGDLYIVQWDGKIYNSTKAEITALGGELFQYIPQNAFAVRMTRNVEIEVAQLPYIRSVTPFYLYYKIDPMLVSMQAGTSAVDFSAWQDKPTGPIVDHIRAVGGDIESIDPVMVRAWVDRTQLLEVASDPLVSYAEPHMVVKFANNVDADIINVRHVPDAAWSSPGDALWMYSGGTGGTFNGLATGKGTIVADVDTGCDGTHPNFGDAQNYPAKKVWFKSYTSINTWFDNDGHGTHTSGTAVGIGKHRSGTFDGLYAGMAPEAGLIEIRMDGQNIYNYMNDPLTRGANISTNSWGSIQDQGQYDSEDQVYDRFVRDADNSKPGDQSLTTFFSAGNDGSVGISIPGTAKNIITVGATENTLASKNVVALFSSTGPTADGRIKPDIVAPGDAVTSSWSNGVDFQAASGTSMSSPTAAGAGAVIIDYYNRTWHVTPSPALMKALLINGADPMPAYSYPDGNQGWGRIDISNSLLETATRKIFHVDASRQNAMNTGMYLSYPVTVNSGAGELRAHLVWLDKQGAVGANVELVNDLDLRVIDPNDKVYMGNNFQGDFSHQSLTSDTINNVEGFRASFPMKGQWKVEVVGSNIPQGPQDWALVISGDISVGTPKLFFQDIAVTNFELSNNKLVEGVPVKVGATINNVGSLPMANIDYTIAVDDTPLTTDTIASLAVSAGQDVSVTYVPVRGHHTINVTADPLSKFIDINRINNTILQDITVDNFGLTTVITPKNQDVQPGQNTTFRIDITNSGTLQDAFNLTVGNVPTGYNASLSANHTSLLAGKKASLTFQVGAPAKAIAGSKAMINVTVTSGGNATYRSKLQANITISKITGFSIKALGDTSVKINQSVPVSFEMNMTNLGNDFEPVVLTLSSTNPNWMASLNVTNTDLAPFRTVVLNMTVTPPSQVGGGDTDILTVSGTTASGISDQIIYSVTAAEVHDLTMAATQTISSVAPGDDLSFDIDITNNGNVNDGMILSANAPKGWSANFKDLTPQVGAYGKLQDPLTVNVPMSALSGQYNITITASGDYINTTKTFSVKVQQNFGVSLSVLPSVNTVKQKNSTVFVLTVTNKGNGPDTFTLELNGGPVTLVSAYDKDTVTLGPGRSAKVNLTVQARSTVAGSYNLTCTVTSRGNQSVSQVLKVQVKVQAPTPGGGGGGGGGGDDKPKPSFLQAYGLYLLAGVVILIAIIVMIVLLMRRKKSKEMPIAKP